ncbi:MAG: leucine-rich repeat protein [Bacteroidaceae bacterium]|nr:leucine-rich repeat protein [Bacteroidaceae bacterium]
MASSSNFTCNENTFEESVLIGDDGATSLSYRVCHDGRLYFMKQLRPELFPNHSNRVLLQKEFALGKSIEHNNVVKYDSIYESEEEMYILMEYVQGSTVEEKLKNDTAFFKKEHNIRRFTLQLLDGLKALHSKGIAYVDINAGNIMLTQVGDNVKIVDLGFCFSNKFSHATFGVTKEFAAPEILEGGTGNIDERSDIYAVGCLLRYIKRKSGAKYSRHFENIIKRCIKKERSERFATADEVISAINAHHKKRNILLGIISLLAVAGCITLLWNGKKQSSSNEPQRIEITESQDEIIYRVLSHEERTCEVIGGNGRGNNIYIQAIAQFGNIEYKTVSIADSAFAARNILSIHLPEGLEKVGYYAFRDCDSVVTISLPNSTTVFNNGFRGMRRLKTIKFPQHIKSISASAFVDCISLEEVYIPEGVERIELDAFGRCYGLKNVYLPQTLKVIERGVFWKCKGLEEITIPARVEEIGDYAFYHCDSLRHIYLHAHTPPAITTILKNSNAVIHVPLTALENYMKHPYWAKYNIEGDL